MYQNFKSGFNDACDTWIIAYCPDADEFFATNQRGFYWESDNEFNTEKEAIDYFENNIQKYLEVKNDILTDCIFSYKPENRVWLGNTNKWYTVEDRKGACS